MTTFGLALWILGGITLQVMLWLATVFFRHWQDFMALQLAADAQGLQAMAIDPATGIAPPKPAWAGLKALRVSRKVLEDAAGQICSFYLTPVDGAPLPSFQPGQYLTFRLDLPAAQTAQASTPQTLEPRTITRCYSLSDAPQAEQYRISVKRAPAPTGSGLAPGLSSNFLHDSVDVGDVLQVRAPGGHFFLDPGTAPVVLIGGGVGITPMLSMINTCAREQPEREVWLFYGVRDEAEVVMLPHFQALAAAHPNFHVHLCISRPTGSLPPGGAAAGVHRHPSRLDITLLRSLLPLKPFHFFLCGPTAMLESLVPALEAWGVPDAHIHFEAFGPSSIARKSQAPAAARAPADQVAAPVMVTFTRSGKRCEWSPGMGTLLEFAEAQGIAVESACRSGSCGTCQTAIGSGEVQYLQTPDTAPEPGTCLLCVTAPKTAVSLEV